MSASVSEELSSHTTESVGFTALEKKHRGWPGLSLKNIVLGIYFLFVAVLLVVGFTLSMFLGRLIENSNSSVTAAASIHDANQVFAHLTEYSRASRLFDQTRNSSHKAAKIRELEALSKWTKTEKNLIKSVEESRLFEEVQGATNAYLHDREKMNVNNPKQAEHLNKVFEEAVLRIQRLNKFNLDRAGALQFEAIKERTQAIYFFWLVLVPVVALFPVLWFVVHNWLSLPLDNLNSVLSSFPRQQSSRVTAFGATEFRRLAHAVNSMMDSICDQKRTQLRFLAGVAHDLRNPLGAIKMSLDEMESDGLPSSERALMINIISRQTIYLNQMIGDLLDATRIESGDFELKKTMCSMKQILMDSIQLNKSTSMKHKIGYDGPVELLVVGDPIRLSQVVNNVINNAIKYSPEGGNISVALKTIPKGFLEFSVRDYGIGIAMGDRERIFQPFQRTMRTIATIPGVGLGLSVTKKIIEGHGGMIHVESPEDGGTRFVVQLPLVARSANSLQAKATFTV